MNRRVCMLATESRLTSKPCMAIISRVVWIDAR